ncbi:MAG: hypothetical protein KH452_14265, partial [Clostridiales bacterium]|nr:hypothetical protein [Clostridiales bacterium]
MMLTAVMLTTSSDLSVLAESIQTVPQTQQQEEPEIVPETEPVETPQAETPEGSPQTGTPEEEPQTGTGTETPEGTPEETPETEVPTDKPEGTPEGTPETEVPTDKPDGTPEETPETEVPTDKPEGTLEETPETEVPIDKPEGDTSGTEVPDGTPGEESGETPGTEIPGEAPGELPEKDPITDVVSDPEAPEVEEIPEAEVPEETEEPEEETEIPDLEGVMTFEELEELDELEVGTAWEFTSISPYALSSDSIMPMSAEGQHWSFDAYYVNQDDKYHVEKTDDFNLKYQMEFHNSKDLKKGEVEIRIPAALLKYRDGREIRPSDIAVPCAGPDEDPIPSRSTPFNYYVDEDTKELVFYNYKDIASGSNAAWQVLYKNLEIMEIVDDSKWELVPKITVTPTLSEGEELQPEEKTTQPLTGHINSQVELLSVSKTPHYEGGKSYSPGLYTEEQVERYISGELPNRYKGENFQKYRYVVWDVKVKGRGNQPWNLWVKDKPSIDGSASGISIVGYRGVSSPGYYAPPENGYTIDKYDFTQVKNGCKEAEWGSRFYIVTAYPADEVIPNQTVLENTVDIRLEPFDEIDPVQEKSAEAQWSYADYDWIYSGNTIGIEKENYATYNGWLEVYKQAQEVNEDMGDFPFSTEAYFRGYELTHVTDSAKGELGSYQEGRKYTLTTVDDFMYLYPENKSPSEGTMLTSEDYYFTGVTITQTDRGYDVWEDRYADPEQPDPEHISQNMVVYVMYEGKTEWTEVENVKWNDSGILSCTLTPDQLADKPWRVKVVHETTNYDTACRIDVKVRLRHTSPAMKALMIDYKNNQVNGATLEDISGVIGASYENDVFLDYHHDKTAGGPNYQEPGLEEATKELYKSDAPEDNGGGLLLQRDSESKRLTGLEKHAASHKAVEVSNDPNNSRVLLNYSLTAYDGYRIYSQEGVNYLTGKITSPGRNKVVFYDLLPYGVHLDPSREIVAGRITNLYSDNYINRPGSWDKSQVTVTVDSEKDITPNWENTGRTMVAFHVEYQGADPAVYTDEMWMEGWGVNFRAYYDWKDLDVVGKGENICAFMPETGDKNPLLGEPGEVCKDDGTDADGVPLTDEYAPFQGGDLNKDNVTGIENVLYAKAVAEEDIALASESKIEKLVRADADRFGIYGKSAVVEPDKGYTYDITVSNANGGTLKNIVVYDRLENAAKDRADADKKDIWRPFDNGSWHGTFKGVVTTGLEELGIKPVIYYSNKREAHVPEVRESGAEPPEQVLKEEEWYTESRFKEEFGPDWKQEVQAVAVDLSKKTDDSDFELEEMKSVTFQIHMTAPENITPGVDYAYNNPSFYSVNTSDGTKKTVEGNSVRVGLSKNEKLEIIKVFGQEPPAAAKDTKFEFRLWEMEGSEENQTKRLFSNQEYKFYKKTEDGGWELQDDRLYATDNSGRLYLHADEKAVFENLPDADRIQVEESENPFWEVTKDIKDSENAEDGIKTHTLTFTNTYRPVLYVQKKLEGVPEGVDVSNDSFTFQIHVKKAGENEWSLLADSEFWYVDSVRTDGGIPKKDTSHGTNGIGQTDAEGKFKIQEGQIIALFPGEAGTFYKLTETETGKDWICNKDTVEGQVPALGASASIRNIYKWKDLLLTKTLTHQDPEDCTQPFTFKVEKAVENPEKPGKPSYIPLDGNEWVLLNEDGTESDVKGQLESNGEFTCACAGRIVKIKKLEAGKEYRITETASGEHYKPVNGGITDVTMPIYSSSQTAEIINDYLLRPLSVTKLVTGITDGKVPDVKFEMTITVEGKPYAGKEYTLTENGTEIGKDTTDENGTFFLKGSQTATFKDVGKEGTKFEVKEIQEENPTYPQIYPIDNGSHSGELDSEGSSVTFINGDSNSLYLSKEYVGLDDTANAYVEKMRNPDDPEGAALRDEAAVELTLKLTKADGSVVNYPDKSKYVTAIDQLTGKEIKVYWYYSSGVRLEPWKMVIIPKDQLQDIVSYELTESAGDQHRVYEYKDGVWLEISQKEPPLDGALTGTLEEKPIATIINQVSSIEPKGSEIWKRMAIGSEEVP